MKLDFESSFIKAAKAAHNTTNEHNINDYPFPIVEVIKRDKDVLLFTYKEFATLMGVSVEDVAKYGCTEEAFHIKSGGKKAIIYNDDKYEKRLRFTLAHEYGHLKMNHNGTSFSRLEKNRKMKLEEYEANTFASCLLFPIHIRNKFQAVMEPEEISDLFNISYESAEIAMKIFDDHMDNGLNDVLSVYEHKEHDSYISFLEEMYESKLEYLESYSY
jgi:Zn-dependent peptidase ImmA (M78 family)